DIMGSSPLADQPTSVALPLSPSSSEDTVSNHDHGSVPLVSVPLRRSTREHRPPAHLHDFVCNN
ncbi:hypothetical protein Dimus_026730, partial [Dionaea muscipula]